MLSVRRLRESVYNHVLRLPMAFLTGHHGQLVSRITNDTDDHTADVQVLFRNAAGSHGSARRSRCDGVA